MYWFLVLSHYVCTYFGFVHFAANGVVLATSVRFSEMLFVQNGTVLAVDLRLLCIYFGFVTFRSNRCCLATSFRLVFCSEMLFVQTALF